MPKKWTEEEERYLEKHYGEVPNRVLAEKFGVSPKAISDKMRSIRKKRAMEAETQKVRSEEEAAVETVSAGFFIKTEEGWKELLLRRKRD